MSVEFTAPCPRCGHAAQWHQHYNGFEYDAEGNVVQGSHYVIRCSVRCDSGGRPTTGVVPVPGGAVLDGGVRLSKAGRALRGLASRRR
jgi:hypothetical protein